MQINRGQGRSSVPRSLFEGAGAGREMAAPDPGRWGECGPRPPGRLGARGGQVSAGCRVRDSWLVRFGLGPRAEGRGVGPAGSEGGPGNKACWVEAGEAEM